MQKTIEHCYCDLHALDLVIEQYAYALELVQPNAPGKIAVRFLKRPWGGVEGRHPQVVQWYKSRGDRYLYNRLDISGALRRVKGYPVFAPVKEDTKTILAETIAIIRHREALLTAINNFKRQLGSMFARNAVYAREKQEQIRRWLPAVLERRELLLAQRDAGVAAAEVALAPDAVADSRKKPRVDVVGRTRGRVHQTGRQR